ncbi:unnamed protein product [Amoebophrya sp. A120]|nr:unnamed protein product [Amoebophrya sp. A120]|eukprot:GSA120T00023201001.1
MQLRHFSVPEEGAFFTRSALETAMGWEPGSTAYDELLQRVRAVRPSAPSKDESSSGESSSSPPPSNELPGAIEGPDPHEFGAAPSVVLLEPGAVLTILPAALRTLDAFQVAEELAAVVGLEHDWFRSAESTNVVPSTCHHDEDLQARSGGEEDEGTAAERAGQVLPAESSRTTSNCIAGVDDAFKNKPGLWKCLEYTAAALSTAEEYHRAEKLVEYDELLESKKRCYYKHVHALDYIISDLQRIHGSYKREVKGICDAARKIKPDSGTKSAPSTSIMHRIIAMWSGASMERMGARVCWKNPDFVQPKESHLLAPAVEFCVVNAGGMVIASGRQLLVELITERSVDRGFPPPTPGNIRFHYHSVPSLRKEFYVLHTLHMALSRELDLLAGEFAVSLPGKMEAAGGLPSGSLSLKVSSEKEKLLWNQKYHKRHHLIYDQKCLWRSENLTPVWSGLGLKIGELPKLPRLDPFSVKPRFEFKQKHIAAIFKVDTISGTFLSLQIQGVQKSTARGNASLGAFGLLDADVRVVFPGDAAPDPEADAIQIKVEQADGGADEADKLAVYVANRLRERKFRVPGVATRSEAEACVSELRTLVQLVQATRTPEGQQLLKLHFDEARSWCESLHVPTADRAAYKNRTFEHLSFSVDGLFEEPSPAEDEKEKSVSDRDDSDGEEREEDESANGRCSDGAGGTNQPDETSGTAGSCADVVPMEDDDHPDGISGNADAVPLDDHDFVGESEPEASAEERNPRILCETDTWLDLLRAVDRHRRATNEPLDAPITIRVGFRMPDLQ